MVYSKFKRVFNSQTWPRRSNLFSNNFHFLHFHNLTKILNQLLFKVENMFRLMDEIFIKSLQSVQKTIINDKHCFELYGYDILLDSNLKP